MCQYFQPEVNGISGIYQGIVQCEHLWDMIFTIETDLQDRVMQCEQQSDDKISLVLHCKPGLKPDNDK